MPAVSLPQQRYMAGCYHNPSKMKGKCPSKKVAKEFMHFKGASYHAGWLTSHRARHGIK